MRTLRHPGVLKVYDTVEVRRCYEPFKVAIILITRADRHVHLYRYGASDTS